MKKAFLLLLLVPVILAPTACNLFFDPKTISYSVTSGSIVAIDVAGAGEDGVVFTSSTQTDWGHSFEVKYTDFPFEAFLAVTNKGAVSVNMAVYLEGSLVTSRSVAAGDTEMMSPSVSY